MFCIDFPAPLTLPPPVTVHSALIASRYVHLMLFKIRLLVLSPFLGAVNLWHYIFGICNLIKRNHIIAAECGRHKQGSGGL